MENIIGVITIAAGTALIIFRKRFVREVVKVNNEGLGFYKYGKREEVLGYWLVPLFGLLFIVIGILVLTSVIEFKQP